MVSNIPQVCYAAGLICPGYQRRILKGLTRFLKSETTVFPALKSIKKR